MELTRVQNKIFYFKLITKLLNYMFVRRVFFSLNNMGFVQLFTCF